jgi:hypothetical protein
MISADLGGLRSLAAVYSPSLNCRHNALTANELYEKQLFAIASLSIKRKFLAQVIEPQALVNAGRPAKFSLPKLWDGRPRPSFGVWTFSYDCGAV